MYQPKNITEFFINKTLKPGDTAIDATAGNGNDTLKLLQKIGENGKVFAFDIQKQALLTTQDKLKQNGYSNYELILDSHSKMDKYVNSAVSCVIFNLGYLPGSDHSICTKSETTITAIEKSLNLIHDDGFVSVTVYYGKNSGTDEKDSVMNFLKTIDHKKYTVLLFDFYNRPNNPPLTIIITKNS